ncbi:unnamed protein product [Darwinula stevensoni]|uniref:SMB domain-containing protein n=1 Tax=Darwinula stevensoni TaxID=69355 RepID=A0A7R9A3C4_9CRUS|nr:unnamed protein product [Darwinula stevensoni]CAG0881819.1 unnamed protein product [Darwinula stevensoni]
MSGLWWLFNVLAHLAWLCSGLVQVWDIPGDYCRTRSGGCCPGRIDQCSVPILRTLCYCDAFCDRRENPDCCPDYHEFCLGISKPATSPEPLQITGGSLKTISIVCSKCVAIPGDPRRTELICEQEACLIQPDLIEQVNRLELGWKASNYSDFWSKTLQEGLSLKLGTLEPERTVRNMFPILKIYERSSIPRSFDSRQKWGEWIQPVRDQGWCGASWAFSTTAVASDRRAIQSNGRFQDVLSVQHLVDCTPRKKEGCKGYYLDRAWNYMRKAGLTTEACYPYTSGLGGEIGTCKIPKSFWKNGIIQSSVPPCANQLARSQPPYKIKNVEYDIMHEIMTNGPVQGESPIMKIYSDFFMYRGGIYSATRLRPSQPTGFHAVRIVGWGEDYVNGSPKKYWLVANSWGPEWGENGFFRITRGVNECDIEMFVIGAWSDLRKRNKGSSRRRRHKNLVY